MIPFSHSTSYDGKGCLGMSEGNSEVWFDDQTKIECLAALISGLSLSERNLTASALDFQGLGLAKKHQIESAIKRAVELGKVLDDLIELLRKSTFSKH